MKRFLNNLLIFSLVWLEASIIYLMLLVYYPVPVQKIEKILTDKYCGYSQMKYDYRVEGGDLFNQVLIEDAVKDLNEKMGYKLFSYNQNSKNVIYVVKKIPGLFSIATMFGETIGLTSCDSMCCGNNNYDVQFNQDYLYSFLRAKILVWHEFGHIVGLAHDDSKADIMNTYNLDEYKFTEKIEKTYLNKLKNRMNIE